MPHRTELADAYESCSKTYIQSFVYAFWLIGKEFGLPAQGYPHEGLRKQLTYEEEHSVDTDEAEKCRESASSHRN